MYPACINEWLHLLGCGNKLLSLNTYMYSRRTFSSLFFPLFSRPHIASLLSVRNAKPTGWCSGRRGWLRGIEKGVACAVKRGVLPSRTSSPDEIKTLALVVGKKWPPRGMEKSEGDGENTTRKSQKLPSHGYGSDNGHVVYRAAETTRFTIWEVLF